MELRKRNWDEISITDYKRIVEISKRELDSDMEKDIAVLSVLCEVSEKDLYDLQVNELSSLLMDAGWIKKPFTFNRSFKLKKLKLERDGIKEEYIVAADLDKMTVAQYMDFQNFWDKRNDYMGNLLTVFIIPKGHKYNDGYDILGLAQYFEDTLSIKFWNEVCFFFLHNYLISIQASIVYSDYMTRRMIRKTKDKERKKMLIEKEKDLREKLKQILAIG